MDAEQGCKAKAAQGLNQFEQGNFAEAEKSYQSAKDLAKRSQNALQLPLALRELARSYTAQNKLRQAEETLREALRCYDGLAKQTAQSTRFNKALVDERKYETLASLGDCCRAQGRLVEAKDAYAQAIAIGDKIVEPPTISNQVKQSYINVLEQLGEKAVAYNLQLQVDASTCSLDEFDQRFQRALKLLAVGQYEKAQKIFDTLVVAGRGFFGPKVRLGKVLTYVALMKIIHNQPAEGEQIALESVRVKDTGVTYPIMFSKDYALVGLARAMQGDIAAGAKYNMQAFKASPFNSREILLVAEKGLKDLGHSKESQIVSAQLKAFKTDPRFAISPHIAIDFVLLAKEQEEDGDIELAKQTRLNGLTHLEREHKPWKLGEMRGAYQLYKIYTEAGEKSLAARALLQVRSIGNRTEAGRRKLKEVLELEGLPM